LNGDKRDQFYAECGVLRSSPGIVSVPQISAGLTRILEDPIAMHDYRLRIRCLSTEGDLLRDDHPDSAAQAWKEVFTLAERLNDHAWQARANAELGIIEFLDGNTGKARSLVTSALLSALARADLPTLVIYGSQVGNGLVEMGRGAEALDYCNATLTIAGMVKDMGFPYLAYGCKARALVLLGRPDEAHRLLEQILERTRHLHMPLEQSQALIVLGQVAAAVGDRAAATHYFEDAGTLGRASGFMHSLAWSMYEAAKVYRDEGRYADAERCETVAMNAMRQVGDEYHLPLHLAVFADLQAKEGHLAKAHEFYGQAEDVTESLLINSPNEQVESSLIATMSDVYKGEFALSARSGQTAEGFRIVETARGRSIVDLLRQPRSREIKLSDTEKNASADFNLLQRNLMETSDRNERAKILDKLFVAEQLMGARTQAPNTMHETAVRAQPISLAAAQQSLLPDETIPEYVLAEPASYCLVLTRMQAVIVKLPAGQAQISKTVSSFLTAVSRMQFARDEAKQLYSLLLAPVPQALRLQHIVVVPDGSLHQLPFDALIDPDGNYVLRNHVVSYAPSATVLCYLRNRHDESRTEMAFLGVGDVPYDLEPLTAGGGAGRQTLRFIARGIYDISGAHLSYLPGTRKEVRDADGALGRPKQSLLLLGGDATKTKFKSEPLSHFRVIHFAVHGLSVPHFPQRAALVLGRDPHSTDDGLLQFREIAQLPLSADLVTLSACDTAIGELQGEEGSTGLVQAFLFAGAKSVVASVWAAEDWATELLMKQFYTHLAEKEDKASALRQAKLDYLDTMTNRTAPIYWASFVLVGDGSAPISF